jgi:hypothetical protein
MGYFMDPYSGGLFSKNPYARHSAIKGRIVVVLDAHLTDRELHLIQPISRAVKRNDIHELIATREKGACPGAAVNEVWYIAFFEVTEGGVIVVGDEVLVGGRSIGCVVGFDDTHLPNHQNIILRTEANKTGLELEIGLGEPVLIGEKGSVSERTQL